MTGSPAGGFPQRVYPQGWQRADNKTYSQGWQGIALPMESSGRQRQEALAGGWAKFWQRNWQVKPGWKFGRLGARLGARLTRETLGACAIPPATSEPFLATRRYSTSRADAFTQDSNSVRPDRPNVDERY